MKTSRELNIKKLDKITGAGYDRNFISKPDGDHIGRMMRERSPENSTYISEIFTNW